MTRVGDSARRATAACAAAPVRAPLLFIGCTSFFGGFGCFLPTHFAVVGRNVQYRLGHEYPGISLATAMRRNARALWFLLVASQGTSLKTFSRRLCVGSTNIPAAAQLHDPYV
jgi:hypothetical protein